MSRSISKKTLKQNIWKKTGGICAHCGKPAHGKAATVDHFVPRSSGGGFDQRNLLPLCKNCNQNRRSDSINPTIYYKYAPVEAIEECLEYEKEFLTQRTNIYGEYWEI